MGIPIIFSALVIAMAVVGVIIIAGRSGIPVIIIVIITAITIAA